MLVCWDARWTPRVIVRPLRVLLYVSCSALSPPGGHGEIFQSGLWSPGVENLPVNLPVWHFDKFIRFWRLISPKLILTWLLKMSRISAKFQWLSEVLHCVSNKALILYYFSCDLAQKFVRICSCAQLFSFIRDLPVWGPNLQVEKL